MHDALCCQQFGDCAETLSTTLDCDEIIRKWRNEIQLLLECPQDVDLRKSEEAGGYLCEYIYYNSLAWYTRRDRAQAADHACDRPVLFLHVPAGEDAPDVQLSCKVTSALLQAIAQSWSISKRYMGFLKAR